MITAIARLGQALRGESDIESLVDQTNAKTVLVLVFEIGKGGVKYAGMDIEEKRGDELYLYRRDLAGRGAGLFLTGRISRFDLRAFQRSVRRLEKDSRNGEAKRSVEEFLRRKVDWLSRGGIIRDRGLRSSLSPKSDAILESLVREIESRSRTIHADFVQKIQKLEAEELLLTVKLGVDSQKKYIGEFPEYVTLFRKVVTRSRETGRAAEQSLKAPACTVCNRPGLTAKFSQPPLPFVTTDKPGFTPNGDQDEAYKVFPLCSDCFLDLRRGMMFVKKHLDFSISSIEGGGAEISFWLIPILDEHESVLEFIKDIGESAKAIEGNEPTRFLYLKNLKGMCNSMRAVTTSVSGEDTRISEAYLAFMALFYAKDRQGHMRLISRADGIYPKRLRFLTEVKREVDSLYPFEKVGIRFGFPLLREFLASPKSEGWYKDLASTLGDIFTGELVKKPLVYKAVAYKIEDLARNETNLEKITNTVLRGLSLIEFVAHLEGSSIEETSPVNSQVALGSDGNQSIQQVRDFIDAHSTLLRDGTLRGIFASGVATGILLEVQRKRSKGRSMPFWGRLNRLEMDLARVKQLFPQILNKLHEYNIQSYDEVLMYLGSQEVSNMDLSRNDLSEDVISLVFAVGMSEGYRISHEKRM